MIGFTREGVEKHWQDKCGVRNIKARMGTALKTSSVSTDPVRIIHWFLLTLSVTKNVSEAKEPRSQDM